MMTSMPSAPPGHPVHVASGASAAGCLRSATAEGLLPGLVLAMQDDLSVGPLGDTGARNAFWQALAPGYSVEPPAHDVASDWVALRTAAEEGHGLVVWGGANPAELILFNAVCAHAESVWHVDVSVGRGGPHYLAEYRPVDAARLWPDHVRAVSDEERDARAQEYRRLAAAPDIVRRFELGEVVAAPADIYDPWLVAACDAQWVSAARVVGAAMARCDPHNRVGDVYLAHRLGVLIDAGTIEHDGARSDLRSYRVRLPDPAVPGA